MTKRKAKRRKRADKQQKFTIRIPKITTKDLVKHLDTASIYFIGITAFSVSLIFMADFYYSFEFPKYILLLISTVTISVMFIIRSLFITKKSLLQSPLISILILFLFTYLISSIFSINPITSIIGVYGKWSLNLLSVSCFTLLALITANVVDIKKHSSIIAWFISMGGFLSALTALVTTYLFKDNTLVVNGRLSSTQGHPIHLGIFLTMSLPVTLYLLFIHKNRTLKVFITLNVLLQLFTTVLTYSRGAWISVIIGSILFLIFHVKEKDRTRKLINWGLLGIVLICSSLLLPAVRDRIKHTWEKPREENSINIRYSEWKSTFEVFLSRPISGTGPEMLYTELPKHKESWINKTEDWNLRTAYTRNLYLHLLATTGIIGITPFLILAVFTVIKIFKKAKSATPVEKGFFIGFIVFLINSIHYHPTITSLCLGAIMLGITIKAVSKSYRIYPISKKPHILIPTAVILSGIIVIILILQTAQADRSFNKSLEQHPSTAIATLNKVIEKNPYEPTYYRQKTDYLYQFLELYPDTETKDETVRLIRNEYTTAISLNPYDLDNYMLAGNVLYKLDLLYPNEGFDEKALEYGKISLQLAPKDALVHDVIGLYYMENGDHKKALELFNKAIDLKKDFWASYLHKGDILLYVQNKPDKAQKLYEKVKNSSNDSYQVKIAIQRLAEIENSSKE